MEAATIISKMMCLSVFGWMWSSKIEILLSLIVSTYTIWHLFTKQKLVFRGYTQHPFLADLETIYSFFSKTSTRKLFELVSVDDSWKPSEMSYGQDFPPNSHWVYLQASLQRPMRELYELVTFINSKRPKLVKRRTDEVRLFSDFEILFSFD
jgi:hypothetical protein